MGSVKDLVVIHPPTEDRVGRGRFVFSDRYSVFDWGEMPDHLPGKGAALALIGAWFFERMTGEGIPHHYLGLVERDQALPLSRLSSPSRIMEVRLVRVVRPEKTPEGYDYSVFGHFHRNVLLPLEVIYRRALPPGSSVHRRIARGELSWEDLGLPGPPESEILPRPVLDFSTKLEPLDRYLTREEARRISGLSDEQFRRLETIALALAELITERMDDLGIVNLDGKFEFALDEKGEIMVVDVVGTPDECRFSWEGLPLSKELLRMYYRATPWYRRLEEAKSRGDGDLHREVGPPPPLPSRWKETVSLMYQALANAVTGKRWFDVPDLPDVLARVREILKEREQTRSQEG